MEATVPTSPMTVPANAKDEEPIDANIPDNYVQHTLKTTKELPPFQWNNLLNEMDGLRPDADILFILTTNRPDALEDALAARPGRVD